MKSDNNPKAADISALKEIIAGTPADAALLRNGGEYVAVARQQRRTVSHLMTFAFTAMRPKGVA